MRRAERWNPDAAICTNWPTSTGIEWGARAIVYGLPRMLRLID